MAAWSSPEYRFFVAGARTGQVVSEFSSVNGMNLNLMLNRPGAVSFSIPWREASLRFRNGWRTVYPGSHAIYVERDGQVIFGGVVDSITTKNADAGLNIAVKGWWDHFRYRLLRQRRLYSNRDIYDIIRTTWDVIEGLSTIKGPDLNMVFPVDTDRGVERTVTYESWELNSFASIVESWANASDTTFDFELLVSRANGGFGLNLVFWHPELGETLDETLRFDRNGTSPHNVADYEFTVAQDNFATQLFGVGSGDSYLKKVSRKNAAWVGVAEPPDQTLEFSEFVQRDGVYSRQDIYVQEHLDNVTERRLRSAGTPPIAFGVTLSRDFAIDQQLLRPGNYVPVQIEDGYVQVRETHRITGVNIKLGPDMTEVVSLQTQRPYIEE